MPTTPAQGSRSLEDYVDLLELLASEGIPVVVVGGCAVGAYARLLGETVLSDDLDLLADAAALASLAERIQAHGGQVRKMPRPRSIPVAVLDWRGLEVNVLTAVSGLPRAEDAPRLAREFRPRSRPTLAVWIADPFDLLRNKLGVDRPKDRPHVAVLRRFVEEESVKAMQEEQDPRSRIAPAQRLLAVCKQRTLSSELAARLLPLARTPVDFRFLANHLPDNASAVALQRAAPSEVRDEVATILKRRRLT